MKKFFYLLMSVVLTIGSVIPVYSAPAASSFLGYRSETHTDKWDILDHLQQGGWYVATGQQVKVVDQAALGAAVIADCLGGSGGATSAWMTKFINDQVDALCQTLAQQGINMTKSEVADLIRTRGKSFDYTGFSLDIGLNTYHYSEVHIWDHPWDDGSERQEIPQPPEYQLYVRWKLTHAVSGSNPVTTAPVTDPADIEESLAPPSQPLYYIATINDGVAAGYSNVRPTPSTSNEPVDRAHPGECFLVLNRGTEYGPDWKEVMSPHGVHGFMHVSQIKILGDGGFAFGQVIDQDTDRPDIHSKAKQHSPVLRRMFVGNYVLLTGQTPGPRWTWYKVIPSQSARAEEVGGDEGFMFQGWIKKIPIDLDQFNEYKVNN